VGSGGERNRRRPNSWGEGRLKDRMESHKNVKPGWVIEMGGLFNVRETMAKGEELNSY